MRANRPAPASWRDDPLGFTLIELMIVVAVIGVLAAVALVGYNAYNRKARTQEVHGFFGALVGAQAEYRRVAGEYFTMDSSRAGTPDFCPEGMPSSRPIRWGANPTCISAWRDLGITPPTETLFIYSIASFRPGEACSLDADYFEGALTLDPCAVPGMAATDGHRWLAIAFGNQTDQPVPRAVFATTSSLRGRVLSVNPNL